MGVNVRPNTTSYMQPCHDMELHTYKQQGLPQRLFELHAYPVVVNGCRSKQYGDEFIAFWLILLVKISCQGTNSTKWAKRRCTCVMEVWHTETRAL